MQDINRQLSRDERWDWGDVDVRCFLAHHLEDFVMRIQVRFGWKNCVEAVASWCTNMLTFLVLPWYSHTQSRSGKLISSWFMR